MPTDSPPGEVKVVGQPSGWTAARARVKPVVLSVLAPLGVLAVLLVLVLLVWRIALSGADGRLHLTFLDVGSADAVLVRTPSGACLLVNGGPDPEALEQGLGQRLNPLDGGLDWLVVAAPQEEQTAAMAQLVERHPPEHVLWSGNTTASSSARELQRGLAEAGVLLTRAQTGSGLDLGDGARLKVVFSSARGAVVLVEWDGFRALLPSGLSFEALEALADGAEIGPLTVLLLAASGYAPLNPPEWLASLSPQLAVLSVAAGDASGLPDEAVIEALSGTRLLRTDLNGWIEISTDGQALWVEVEKR